MREVHKQGYWQRKLIPKTLRDYLEYLDNAVFTWMSGFKYYDFHHVDLPCFDICWKNGIWSFTLYAGKYEKMPILLAEVKYRKITFFTYCWTHIFGLNNTFASRTGFWVIDFMISIQNHTVTFLGC